MAVKKAQLDLRIFSTLMTYENSDDIDATALGETLGTSRQKIAGMMYAAMNTDRAYNELIRAGAHPRQIPGWIKRPEGVVTPESVPSHEVKGINDEGNPTDREVPPARGEGDDLDIHEVRPMPSPPHDLIEGTGAGTRLTAIYSDRRLQSEHLKNMGIVQDATGGYVRAVQMPDGTLGFQNLTQAEVEAITQTITKDVGSEISKAAVDELDLQMRTVVRKIGLNPTVFMGYAWVTSEGLFQGDLGDFVNQAVKFMLKYGYGAQASMVVGGTTITDIAGQQGAPNTRERIIPV